MKTSMKNHEKLTKTRGKKNICLCIVVYIRIMCSTLHDSKSVWIFVSSVIKTSMSDHYMISCSYATQVKLENKKGHTTIQYRCYKKCINTLFLADINNLPLGNVHHTTDPDPPPTTTPTANTGQQPWGHRWRRRQQLGRWRATGGGYARRWLATGPRTGYARGWERVFSSAAARWWLATRGGYARYPRKGYALG